ncbi:hypothetical protein EK21DRAFT_75723 [Setomelanomma holmii]|uniref:Uncharacterized protein n=1 Tax=Setomelanomma holmii TaxID=210430 RepID=A0A9P4H0T2_9PLEO|nr:hypothetical protein EK21DRAFT_75723 [Setomelanomma holmii]
MHFSSLALPLFSLLALTAAHPNPAPEPVSLAPRGLTQYPADQTIDMVKRAHLEARCNVACPCNWYGMTICCECNC